MPCFEQYTSFRFFCHVSAGRRSVANHAYCGVAKPAYCEIREISKRSLPPKSANRSLLPIGPDFGSAGRACVRMAPDTRRSQTVKYCDSSCVTKTKKRYSFRDDRT